MDDPDPMEPLSRQWLIPIFDKEDLDDINALQKLSEIPVSLDPYGFITEETHLFVPELPALNSGPQLRDKSCKFSPVGAFIYYAYLLWIKVAHVRYKPAYYDKWKLAIEQDICNVERFLGKLLSPGPEALNRYKRIVVEKLHSARRRARSDTLTPGEYVILFDPDKFFILAKECLAVPGKKAANDISERSVADGNSMHPTTNLGNKVFICYNRDEKEWRNRFVEWLAPYQTQGLLEVCYDELMPAAADWEEWITRVVAESKVALVLVTRKWMASEFIYKKEWPLIREAFKQKRLTIRWVHVSLAPYAEHPEFRRYQAAYDPETLLDRLKQAPLEDALNTICKEISQICNAPEVSEARLVECLNARAIE